MEDFVVATNGRKIFQLGDSHKDCKYGYMRNVDYSPDQSVRAIFSGEYRFPKKGEWYLSGIPVAYQAPNDLHTKYHIARIVKVEKIVQHKITKYLDN